MGDHYTHAFNKGILPGIFTRLKCHLVPPDFKEYCIRNT